MTIIGNLVVFAFVILIGKVLLGCAAVWLLLPKDGRCSNCDERTLPLQDPAGLSLTMRLLRVQRRWCMRCAATEVSRRPRGLRIHVRQEPDRTAAPLV